MGKTERILGLTASIISIFCFCVAMYASFNQGGTQFVNDVTHVVFPNLPPVGSPVGSQINTFSVKLLIWVCLCICMATAGAFWSVWATTKKDGWSAIIMVVSIAITSWAAAFFTRALVTGPIDLSEISFSLPKFFYNFSLDSTFICTFLYLIAGSNLIPLFAKNYLVDEMVEGWFKNYTVKKLQTNVTPGSVKGIFIIITIMLFAATYIQPV